MYEDVPEVLRSLHASGLKIGLISNTQRSLTAFQSHFALEGLFAAAVSSFDHGYMKPHRSIFEAALRQVAAEPREAVMVGDSLPADIEGALGLGMRAVLVSRSGDDGHARWLSGRGACHPIASRIAGATLMQIRPLTTLDECRQVAALERTVWGYTDAEDVVPPPVLIVSIKRGGVLLGAFDDGGTMRGFVYSMPAMKEGRPTQWSHMLGVAPEMRAAGLGARLKLAQRQAALDMGIDLIEWTYDPLQAAQRPPELRQARHRRRGVRGEHLRGIEQPAAPRNADRSSRGRVAPS